MMPAYFAAAVLVLAFAVQDPAPVQNAAPPAPPARKLALTFDSQGRVTLVAQNVTVGEILAEWSRKGGTKIQGAERLAGGPIQIPMQFDQRPELEVIEALTRGAAGISVAPRRAGAPGASQFETVYILATSAATQASPYSSAPSMNVQQSIRGVPDDEIPPVNAPGAQGQPPPAAPKPPAAQPGGSVIVPVVPVGPAGTTAPPGTTGRGGGGGTTTTTTGRGGGGGGNR